MWPVRLGRRRARQKEDRSGRPSRPGRERLAGVCFARRAGRAGPSPAVDHRSVRGRRAADDRPERNAAPHLQRRDLQLHRASRGVEGEGRDFPDRFGQRRAAARLFRLGPGLPAQAARHVRFPDLGRAPAPPRGGPRPLRHQAAVLFRHPARRRLRLGNQAASRAAWRAATHEHRADPRFSRHWRQRPSRGHDVRGRQPGARRRMRGGRLLGTDAGADGPALVSDQHRDGLDQRTGGGASDFAPC